MTQDDQDSAIGRLIRQYSDAKQKRVALISECNRISMMLETVAKNIKTNDLRDPAQPISKLPASFPSREDLAALIDDLNEVNRVIVESRRLVKDAGLTVD